MPDRGAETIVTGKKSDRSGSPTKLGVKFWRNIADGCAYIESDEINDG